MTPIAAKLAEVAEWGRRIAKRRWPPPTHEEMGVMAETVAAVAETVERLEQKALEVKG